MASLLMAGCVNEAESVLRQYLDWFGTANVFVELQQTRKVNPERYRTRWQVADLLGLQEIYELERRYGESQVPVA